jgi:hypothetical protein
MGPPARTRPSPACGARETRPQGAGPGDGLRDGQAVQGAISGSLAGVTAGQPKEDPLMFLSPVLPGNCASWATGEAQIICDVRGGCSPVRTASFFSMSAPGLDGADERNEQNLARHGA